MDEEKQYAVFAEVTTTYCFPYYGTSREDAVAQAKDCTELYEYYDYENVIRASEEVQEVDDWNYKFYSSSVDAIEKLWAVKFEDTGEVIAQRSYEYANSQAHYFNHKRWNELGGIEKEPDGSVYFNAKAVIWEGSEEEHASLLVKSSSAK